MPDDREILEQLNRDYVASVQHSDVRRFDEILAEEFYCSNPDGSLIDRAAFLKQTAQPVSISGLEATDVKIRLYGDVAIIHARTTYTTADGEKNQDATPMSGPARTTPGARYQRMLLADELSYSTPKLMLNPSCFKIFRDSTKYFMIIIQIYLN